MVIRLNKIVTFCHTALLASSTILPPVLPLPAVPNNALRFKDHLDQARSGCGEDENKGYRVCGTDKG